MNQRQQSETNDQELHSVKSRRAKLTLTAVGAVGLTLAGLGLVTQYGDAAANQGIQPGAITAAVRATATPTRAAPSATATAPAAAGATAQPTATPAKVRTLNIVQWVETDNGDPVAIVKDKSGVLWYVWGPDVERIEQGLDPEYRPQAVNATARSRGS